MGKSVMIVGLGEVGQLAMEFLARSEGLKRIVAADINEEYGAYRTSMAAVGATLQGYDKSFEFHKVDVYDIDGTAELLKDVQPDVILAALTMQGPRVLRTFPLPQDLRARVDSAGFGPWLPWHVTLVAKLMQAVKSSGIDTHVVNTSFPDVVNPMLRGYGLCPTVGLGNHDQQVGEIIKKVSEAEKVPIRDVTLYFVGSHALADHGSEAGVPFFLKILIGDRNVTSKFDTHALTAAIFRTKVARDSVIYSPIAASGVKNIMAIINDTNEFTHAPSPNGLPGGYPVRLSEKGAEVVLPKELTLEEAMKINTEAQRWDGVEEIREDGTVVYTESAYYIMKELGYDCKELSFEELEPRAQELRALYRKLAEKG